MPTIECRVTSAGNKTYRVKVRLTGAPTVCATFRRKTDALRWGQQTEAAIREGRYFRSAVAKRVTLGATIDRYIREVIPRKLRTGNWRPNTTRPNPP